MKALFFFSCFPYWGNSNKYPQLKILGSIKYHILEYLLLSVSSSAKDLFLHTVSITSFVILSDVGIKRVDCIKLMKGLKPLNIWIWLCCLAGFLWELVFSLTLFLYNFFVVVVFVFLWEFKFLCSYLTPFHNSQLRRVLEKTLIFWSGHSFYIAVSFPQVEW